MRTYIGCKQIKAEPMTLGAYNTHRGWQIPANEDPERPGYLVVYPDGYQSWSHKEAFEKAYLEMTHAHPDDKGPDPSRISKDMVVGFLHSHTTHTMPDGKTTVVQAKLRNGFIITEHSSCVDPANYDEKLGEKIALDRVFDKVWMLLGFLLQSARHGLLPETSADSSSRSASPAGNGGESAPATAQA